MLSTCSFDDDPLQKCMRRISKLKKLLDALTSRVENLEDHIFDPPESEGDDDDYDDDDGDEYGFFNRHPELK